MNITFKPVDESNYMDVINCRMAEGQKGYVEDNLFSLAECYIYPNFIPKAMYADDELIGFVLYYFVEDDPDYVFLHRIMIDEKKQGRGYGKATLLACCELFKEEFPSIGCVELQHYPDNVAGDRLYTACGFENLGPRKSAPGRFELDTEDPNRYIEIIRRRYYD